MIYLLSILFTILFLLYQRYQFRDMKYNRNTTWKTYGWFMKALVIVACYVMQYFTCTWQDCLLTGVISWILFELGYNKIVLKGANLFYVGQSSVQDNTLKKWKWVVMAASLILSIYLLWAGSGK